MTDFDDPLAQALWDARREHRTLDLPKGAFAALTLDRARSIASALYLRLDAASSGAWKLGALDPRSREDLGLEEPLIAPVPSDRLSAGPSVLELPLESFVHPKLEAEVGVGIRGSEVRLLPCIEVADCRFPGWQVPAAAAMADFGLQGAMVFGPEFDPIDEVRVEVRHEGQSLGSGGLGWGEAVQRVALLPVEATRRPIYVATGTITGLFEAKPGLWEFEFRGIATLSLTLT